MGSGTTSGSMTDRRGTHMGHISQHPASDHCPVVMTNRFRHRQAAFDRQLRQLQSSLYAAMLQEDCTDAYISKERRANFASYA
eukprot:16449858-Heterocapsa_arctica.AAC.1